LYTFKFFKNAKSKENGGFFQIQILPPVEEEESEDTGVPKVK
jgi:hypothetical protein